MYLIRLMFCAIMFGVLTSVSSAAVEIKVGVLRVDYPTLLPISRFDLKPDNLGFAGAALATEDNQTTGSFLGITFVTSEIAVPSDKAIDTLDGFLKDQVELIVVMANADDTSKLAKRAAEKSAGRALVINATARETSLRDNKCHPNLLHVATSRAMMADAVSQFAVWKKWTRWFLIHGSNPKDKELADAYRRSAKKFGAKIVEEREFKDEGGSRRTDTGHVLVQRQIPIFTQGAADHDVIIAADESNVFGLYLPYHTWSPRPVLGSGGLRPVTFHPAHEAWGATQFQRRFEKIAGRYMQEPDYNVWLAVRVIGEAAVRTNSADPTVLRDYVLGEGFELAAFKGQKVTFRKWNGQLRQPIILTDSKITISVSPQAGFLHQRSLLDTLGLDQPESACKAFKN